MTKACWMITAGSYPPFPMLGAMLSREEALAAARVIWPYAEVC